MVNEFTNRINTTELCKWVGLPKSVYYYKHKEGKPGAKPSTHTVKLDGTMISNDTVVNDIKIILNQEFVCYGYENVTAELRDLQYIINEKKVYRIMDESNLLLGKVIRTSGKRQFVQHRKIQATHPMEFLCLDIKYVWVDGEKRNYFLLTIIDVFSRKAIEQVFKRSIRKFDVINLFRNINNKYGIKGVTIRNDNGSQFIANDVKQFLRTAEAKQEFTHIATPEENSYIEAFHSIVQREVIERFEFSGYYDAKSTFEAHLKWYNYKRKHRNLGFITPEQKWQQGINNTKNNNQNQYLCLTEKAHSLQNQFNKNVQLLGG